MVRGSAAWPNVPNTYADVASFIRALRRSSKNAGMGKTRWLSAVLGAPTMSIVLLPLSGFILATRCAVRRTVMVRLSQSMSAH